MKKIIVELFMIICTSFGFANELWNGFYSDMSTNEVRQEIYKKFPMSKVQEIKKDSWNQGMLMEDVGKSDRPFTTLLKVKSPAKELNQNINYNIFFCFADNKLYHISVAFNITAVDCLSNLENKYGEPFEKEQHYLYDSWNSRYPSGKYYVYYWKNNKTNIKFAKIDGEQGLYSITGEEYVHYWDPSYKIKYDEIQKKIQEEYLRQQEIEREENLRKIQF